MQLNDRLVAVAALCSLIFLERVVIAAETRTEGVVTIWGGYTISPERMSNVSRIAGGNDWSMAVANGKALFWGRTSQLGDQTGILPEAVSANIVDIAGGSYGAALRNDGTPILWGHNNYVPNGQLQADTGLHVAKIIAGRHDEFWGIKEDGSAVALTSSYIPMCPMPVLTEVVDIVPQALNFNCGQWGYGLVLHKNGSVESYGLRNGQPVIVPPEARGGIALAGGDYSGLLLKADGTLFSWSIMDGNTNVDAYGISIVPPADGTNVVAIAAGAMHYMALRRDGTVVTWGALAAGSRLQPPDGLSDVVQISAGVRHCLALKKDGTVAAWGYPGAVGVMPGGRAVKVVTADQDIYLLRKGGTVGHMGISEIPAGLTDIADIDSDPTGHVLALRKDGTVLTWGAGVTPVPVEIANVTEVAAGGVNFAGSSLNVALKNDHSLAAWAGFAPVSLPPDGFPTEPALENYPGVQSIDGCAGNIIVVTQNGEVREWAGGIMPMPSGLSNVVSAKIATSHALALRGDGAVVGWQVGGGSVLPPLESWTNVVKIDTASVDCPGCRNVASSVAVRADGTVLSWGGPFPAPTNLAGVFDATTSGYSSAALFIPPDPPSIVTFCPPSGGPGTVIQVEGAGFLPVTEVRVNGVPAAFKPDFNFVLNVTVPAGAASGPIEIVSPYGKATTLTNLVVPNGLSAIETWRVLNFGNSANSGAGADLADPDGDGLVNLVEYLHHTNPSISEPVHGLVARGGAVVNDQQHFVFALRHYLLGQEVTVHYEYKLELNQLWQPYTGNILDAGAEPLTECQSEFALKRCAIPGSSNKFYLRYYLTRP